MENPFSIAAKAILSMNEAELSALFSSLDHEPNDTFLRGVSEFFVAANSWEINELSSEKIVPSVITSIIGLGYDFPVLLATPEPLKLANFEYDRPDYAIAA